MGLRSSVDQCTSEPHILTFARPELLSCLSSSLLASRFVFLFPSLFYSFSLCFLRYFCDPCQESIPPTVRRITRFLLTVSGRQPFPLFLSAFFVVVSVKNDKRKHTHYLVCRHASWLRRMLLCFYTEPTTVPPIDLLNFFSHLPACYR